MVICNDVVKQVHTTYILKTKSTLAGAIPLESITNQKKDIQVFSCILSYTQNTKIHQTTQH